MINANTNLDGYKAYLEKLANNKTSLSFSSGSKERASILMSVLFNNTKEIVRLYCLGFKPGLIMTEPYWSSLHNYLNNGEKKLYVLVDSAEFKNYPPMQLLKQSQEKREDKETIKVKQINEEDRIKICKAVNDDHVNFGVFDDNKFRFEYEPNSYNALGSFNKPDQCKFLIDLFDSAFNNSQKTII